MIKERLLRSEPARERPARCSVSRQTDSVPPEEMNPARLVYSNIHDKRAALKQRRHRLFSPWRSAGAGSSYSQTILSGYLSVSTEARSDMNVHVSTFSLKNTQRSGGGQLPRPHYQFTAGQLLLLEVIVQVDSTVQFLIVVNPTGVWSHPGGLV